MTTLSEAIENQISMTGDSDFYVWFAGKDWHEPAHIDAKILDTDINKLEYSFIKAIHIFSDSRGIYIPRDFAEGYKESLEQEDYEVLLDPEHEQYWETWSDILDYVMIPHDGLQYHLYHDGDLYAIAYLD